MTSVQCRTSDPLRFKLPGESWNTRHFTFRQGSPFSLFGQCRPEQHQTSAWLFLVGVGHHTSTCAFVGGDVLLIVLLRSQPSCSSPADERVARRARCWRSRGHDCAGGRWECYYSLLMLA